MHKTRKKSFIWDNTLNKFIVNKKLKQKFPEQILIDTSVAVIAIAEYFNYPKVELLADSFSKQTKNHQANSALYALLLFWMYKYEACAIDFAMEFTGKYESAIGKLFFKAKKKLLPIPALEYKTVIQIVCSESGVLSSTLISHFVNIKGKTHNPSAEIIMVAVRQEEVQKNIISSVCKKEVDFLVRTCSQYVKSLDFSNKEIMAIVVCVVSKEYTMPQRGLEFKIKEGFTYTHGTKYVTPPRGMFFALVKGIQKKVTLKELIAFLTPPRQKQSIHSNVIVSIREHGNRMDVDKTYPSRVLSVLSKLAKVFEVFVVEKQQFRNIEREKKKLDQQKNRLFKEILAKQFV